MIKPTIGRKVWFWADAPRTSDEQPEDATIVFVHSDSCINLQVLDHNGVSRAETSVELVRDGLPQPPTRFAQWMPFQVGQAKREIGDRQVKLGDTVIVRDRNRPLSNGVDEHPAIVNRAWSESCCINAMVFPDHGEPYPAGSVPKIDASSEEPYGWFSLLESRVPQPTGGVS